MRSYEYEKSGRSRAFASARYGEAVSLGGCECRRASLKVLRRKRPEQYARERREKRDGSARKRLDLG